MRFLGSLGAVAMLNQASSVEGIFRRVQHLELDELVRASAPLLIALAHGTIRGRPRRVALPMLPLIGLIEPVELVVQRQASCPERGEPDEDRGERPGSSRTPVHQTCSVLA